MKLCVKKIYCPKCKLSVKAKEESNNGQDRITCSKCGQAICIGNGIYWRRALESELTSGRETESASTGKAKKTKLAKK